MTPLRYATARILCSIGITYKSKRLGDATQETHLLREAEEALGYLCWQEVENIDDLSSEYWTIREYKNDLIQKNKRLSDLESQLQSKQMERQGILAEVGQKSLSIREERAKAVQVAEKLSQERDICITEAKRLRHLFEGQQTKLKVLLQTPEGKTSTEAETVRTKLADIRQQFEEKKVERQRIAEEISVLDHRISEMDQKISSVSSGAQDEASGTTTLVGNINREASSLRAEIGQIEKRISLLYMKIGNHLSRYSNSDKECEKASRAAGSLARKVIALRDSILLNNKLIEHIGR